MKKILSIIFCLCFIFAFSACSSDSDSKAKASVKSSLEVRFEFNEENSVNGRICMNTTLPPETLIDVDVFVGNKYHSTEQVKVQADMSMNYFLTESQVDLNGKEIEDGRYILSFQLVDPRNQPSSVQSVIGKKGELLKGSDVYSENDIKTIKFTRPIEKKGDKFTMSDE